MDTQEIFTRTDNGLDIFQAVLDKRGSNIALKQGKNNGLKNPFYDDQNGSLSISPDSQSGKYLYNDFGDPNSEGDAIDFFARHEGLNCKTDFPKVIERLYQEFAIQSDYSRGKANVPIKPSITERKIETVTLSESPAGWQYWKELFPKIENIEEKAEQFGLKSLDQIQAGSFELKSQKSNPLFAFELGPDCYKTYQPITGDSPSNMHKSNHRWINKHNLCEERFIDLLVPNKPCLITEGYKDAFSAYAHGLNVFPLDNASSVLNEGVIQQIKAKGCEIIYCFDNDQAGKAGLQKNASVCAGRFIDLPAEIQGNPTKDLTDLLCDEKGVNLLQGLLKSAKRTMVLNDELKDLFEISNQIELRSKSEIKWDRPILTCDDQKVIYPNTINVIQGGPGTHKSRLSETIAAALVSSGQNSTKLFHRTEASPFHVAYLDTERNLNNQAPFAKQQMKRMAGVQISEEIHELNFFSLIKVKRDERPKLISQMLDALTHNQTSHLVLILDLFTDLMSDFNNLHESNTLIDLINFLINEKQVTVIAVIHTNPGAEKARGHIGTELVNKASTVMDLKTKGDIIELNFKKTRMGKIPSPIYFICDEETRMLTTTDQVPENKTSAKGSQQKAPIEQVINALKWLSPDIEHNRSKETSKLAETLQCSETTIESRLNEIRDKGMNIPFENYSCTLVLTKGIIQFKKIHQHTQTQTSL
ncbi:MAG: DNA primase [Marinoscillum sp.]|jgi:DNA primase